jgi:hypothetical protein
VNSLPKDPLATLFSLKAGTAPQQDLAFLTIGRDEHLARLGEDLGGLTGTAKRLFLIGDYGEGKSHLLEYMRQSALEQNFAVSKFTVNFDTVLLHRPKLLLHEVMTNLQLPDQKVIGLVPSLRNLADEPSFKVFARQLLEREGAAFDDRFSLWPAALYSSAALPQSAELMGRWMSGEGIMAAHVKKTLNETLYPPSRLAIQVNMATSIIIAFTKVLKELGYKGLVLLADELENALSYRITLLQRGKGALSLHQLITARVPLYLVGAVTPATVAQLRYDQLMHRYEWRLGEREVTALGFMVRNLTDSHALSISPLTHRQRIQLGERVVALHGQAFAWDTSSIDWPIIGRCIEDAERLSLGTRGYLKLLVHVLEIAHQNGARRVSR